MEHRIDEVAPDALDLHGLLTRHPEFRLVGLDRGISACRRIGRVSLGREGRLGEVVLCHTDIRWRSLGANSRLEVAVVARQALHLVPEIDAVDFVTQTHWRRLRHALGIVPTVSTLDLEVHLNGESLALRGTTSRRAHVGVADLDAGHMLRVTWLGADPTKVLFPLVTVSDIDAYRQSSPKG